MAAVDVKMSQAAWDLALKQMDGRETGGGRLGDAVFAFATYKFLLAQSASETGSAKISADRVTVKFADGRSATYVGALSQETPASGSATISSKTYGQKNYFQEQTKGSLAYRYELVDGRLGMESTGERLAYYKLNIMKSVGASADRGGWELNGDLTRQEDNSWAGKLHSLEWTGGQALKSFKVTGDLDVSLPSDSISYQVKGRLDSVSLAYADKSYVRASGAINYSDSSQIGTGMLGDPLAWIGDDTLRLDLPSNLRTEFSVNTGDGNDVISLKGGGGFVHLFGGNGDDRFVLQNALSAIDGGNGIDTIETASSYSLASASGVENLTLTGKANINATGNAADNLITGNAGKNILYGAGGKDLLKGGAGNDIYKLDFSGDGTIDDASGKDTLEISSVFAAMAWNGSTLEIYGYSTPDLEPHKIVILNANKAGAIEYISYPAVGFYYRLSPNQSGSKASELIIGTALGETIRALNGDDCIDAAGGDDVLVGGGGKDILFGGEGADTFKFEKPSDSRMGAEDEVGDFEAGIDKIDLSSIDANARAKGLQAFALSESGPAANAVWFGDGDEAYGPRLFGDVNGDAKADFAIELTGISSPLVASDFIGLA